MNKKTAELQAAYQYIKNITILMVSFSPSYSAPSLKAKEVLIANNSSN